MLMKAAACRTTRLRLVWGQASTFRGQRALTQTAWSARSPAAATRDGHHDTQRHTDSEVQSRDHNAPPRARNDGDLVSPPFVDGLYQPYVLSEQDIVLSRARAYGIRTIEELNSETDLDLSDSKVSKLVDRKSLRHDLKLWRILLDHALLNSGPGGARAIFNGLAKRDPIVKLVEDEFETTYIWQKLLDIAVEVPQDRFLRNLCSEDGIAWDRPNLWAEVVGALTQAHRPDIAVRTVRALAIRYRGLEDLMVLYDILRPKTTDHFNSFLHICAQFPAKGMYQRMTSKLWQDLLPDLAFAMHEYLLSRNDLPRYYEDIEPFVVHLARKSAGHERFLGPLDSAGVGVRRTFPELETFLKPLERVGVGFSVQAYDSFRAEIVQATDDSAQTPGSISSAPPKEYKRRVHDNLVARAFAARGLSFDFILAGLPVLGIKEIGPQALRELGLSSSDAGQVSERVRRLHEIGIDTGGAAFSRFVRFYLSQGKNSLVDAAIKSDMHVDVFEDTALQHELLSRYVLESDWPNMNLVLAMLMIGRTQEAVQQKSGNLMLSARVQASSHRSILKELSRQDTNNSPAFPPTSPVLSPSTFSLLVDRARQAPETSATTAQVAAKHTFLFALLQELAISGQQIPVLFWRRSLITMARWSSFDQTAAMILWVTRYCHEARNPAFTHYTPAQVSQAVGLSKLFDIRFQAALILYYVQKGFVVHERKGNQGVRKSFLKQNLEWRKCLVLLKQLEQRYGVYIHVKYLCEAVRLLSAEDPAARPAKPVRNMTPHPLIFQRFKLINAHAILAGIQQLWPEADVHAPSLLHNPLSKHETRRKMNMLIPPKHLGRTQRSANLGPYGWEPKAQILKDWNKSA